MTTATLNRNFARELVELDSELQEKNSQRDRAMATGNEPAVTRLSNEVAALEQKRRNIESSRRGLHQIAQEEAAARDAKARQAAAAEANRLLTELAQHARELEGIEGHLLRKLAEIHHTEDSIAAALIPFATGERQRGFLHRASYIVGRNAIEEFLAGTNLVGLGEQVAKSVTHARELVERIIALPLEEET
jgi:hypothetical protein